MKKSLLSVGVLFIVFSFVLLFYSYNGFIALIVDFLNRPDKKELIQNQYFTINKFNLSIIWLFFIGLILIGFSFYSNYIHFHLIEFKFSLNKNYKKIKFLFFKLPKSEKKAFYAVFFCLFLFKIYCLIAIPFTYDECFVWTEFVLKGPLVSASYYPIHGNHLLQTVISSLISIIWDNPYFSMRFPTLLISSISGFIFFVWISKEMGNLPAFAAWLVYELIYVSFLHSFLGRGYSWEILFTLICFLSILYNQKYIFIFFSILAYYTLPSFLYVHIGIIIWCIIFQIKDLKIYLKSSLIVVFISFILYSPIFLFNDLSIVSTSAYYEKWTFIKTIQNSPDFINQIFQLPDFLSLKEFIFIPFLFTVFIFVKNLKQKFAQLFLILWLLPLCFFIIQQIFLPAKAFIWTSILIAFCVGLVVKKYEKSLLILPIGVFWVVFAYFAFQLEFSIQFEKQILAHDFWKKSNNFIQNEFIWVHPNSLDVTDTYAVIGNFYCQFNNSNTKFIRSGNEDYNYLQLVALQNVTKNDLVLVSDGLICLISKKGRNIKI